MAGSYIEVKGLEPILASLGRIDNMLSELAEPTRETLELLKRRMQHYPPPPAGSRYTRTQSLKNSWEETIILSGSVLGRVQSLGVSYAGYVQDEAQQAAVHRGRWQTRQDVARQEEKTVIAIYEDYIQELINKL